MSAETLRRAAALMRERAEAATPGVWTNTHVVLRRGGVGLAVTQHPMNGGKFILCDPQSDARKEDAVHIAAWHPAVALAVADLLVEVAHKWEVVSGGSRPVFADEVAALAVANAYLGEPA